MTAVLLLLQILCSVLIPHPLIYGEASAEKEPLWKEGVARWMDDVTSWANTAIASHCSSGLLLFSYWINAVSRCFRYIAQLLKE